MLFATTPLLLLVPFLIAMEQGNTPGLDAVTFFPVLLSALLAVGVGIGGSPGAAVLASSSWLAAAGLSFRLAAPWATALFGLLTLLMVAGVWWSVARRRPYAGRDEFA